MESPKVFVVILQYNNSQDTIRCLNFVKEFDYSNYQVIVVDNKSDAKHFENTNNLIKTLDPEKYYLKINTINSGYSGGNNLGIKFAQEKAADYVLILNNDTEPGKDLIPKLLETYESDEQIGIAGPCLDEGNLWCGNELKWLKPELKHINLEEKGTQNFFVPGTCMLIPKGTIEKIGLFDERYFLYFEDADYNVQVQKAGYKTKIIWNATLRHSSQASATSLGPELLLRYHYRNSHLFNSKNGPWYIKIALPFWSIFIIIKQLAKIILAPSKRKVSMAILAGVGDFYKRKFGKINL